MSIVRIAADGWSANELRTVAQNINLPPLPSDQQRWWFIDEVTAVNGEWAANIKWLRDNDPQFAEATVVLTGSNAEALTAAAGVLAGRRGRATNVDRTLLPMGFRTFIELLRPDLAGLPQLKLEQLRGQIGTDAYQAAMVWLPDLVQLWEMYLHYGGFPVAVAAALAVRPIPTWFVNDLFSVIHRDAFFNSRLSESQMSALVARVWSSMAAPANLSNIGQDLSLNQDVVARHIRYLRDAYLLWNCPQKAPKAFVPRERSQDKLYAIDPLVARLAHLRHSARRDIDLTVLAEMQTGMALRRAIFADGWQWSAEDTLFYYRTPARKEIDFVSEALGDIAIEGKYVQTGAWRGEASTVDASEWLGIFTTRDVLDCNSPDKAWAVPNCVLAALIDT